MRRRVNGAWRGVRHAARAVRLPFRSMSIGYAAGAVGVLEIYASHLAEPTGSFPRLHLLHYKGAWGAATSNFNS